MQKITFNRLISQQAYRFCRISSIGISASLVVACGDSSTVLTDTPAAVNHVQTTNPQTTVVVTHQHPNNTADNRFTTVAEGVWPPQPRNMTNVQPYGPTLTTPEVINQVVTVKRNALNNPQVVASLGTDYQDFASQTSTLKNGENQTTMEFYNYATNEAIQIDVAANAPLVVSKSAASLYQPPESRSEKTVAIEIAASALRSDGFEDLGQYQGTAMLAYPPASEVARTGSQFYSERMLYVTFGSGNGELPVYRALVNLNTETAVSRGPIQ